MIFGRVHLYSSSQRPFLTIGKTTRAAAGVPSWHMHQRVSELALQDTHALTYIHCSVNRCYLTSRNGPYHENLR